MKRVIFAVDSHTMGEPTRIVVGGIPHLPGKTMAEKKNYLEKEQDALRTSLMLEPRGHKDMLGSILTAPVSEEADLGIVFMDPSGYLNMCGHGTIGAVTVRKILLLVLREAFKWKEAKNCFICPRQM